MQSVLAEMELMELENIVANTVYIKAKEGGPDNNKGRSKKWRKLLAFPHISQCVEIQVNVRMDREIPAASSLIRQDKEKEGRKLGTSGARLGGICQAGVVRIANEL